jgi:hypothetical protein
MFLRLIATFLAAGVLTARQADAHGMRTAYLEMSERSDGGVLATWRTSVPDATVVPRFPTGCIRAAEDDVVSPDARTFSLRCAGGLAGGEIAVEGLGPVLTEAVVRIVRPDGTVLTRVLRSSAPAWIVPMVTSWLEVGRQYVELGILHIVTGFDHLLFLLALVLYVRRPRLVFVTETAFTLSHSITFSATALGLIHVSAVAAEACIALSLVLVALDVGREEAAQTVAWKGPLIALVFGLVHGLGFAGALSAVGLPDGAVASALVGFGLGVEIGQIIFLVGVMLALAAIERSRIVTLPRVALAGSYAVGIVGAYWLFDRLWRCFA